MRRVATGLAIVMALILTNGSALAHDHDRDHWSHPGHERGHYTAYYPGYYAYRPPVVVAPAPVVVAVPPVCAAPTAVYPAPGAVYGPTPTVVAPYYAPGIHSSLYLGGRHFGVAVGF